MFGIRQDHEKIIQVDKSGKRLQWKDSVNGDYDNKDILLDSVQEVVEGGSLSVINAFTLLSNHIM